MKSNPLDKSGADMVTAFDPLSSPPSKCHKRGTVLSPLKKSPEKKSTPVSPAKTETGVTVSAAAMKRYQKWQGNNMFLCRGWLMLGVHVDHLCLTVTLMTITWSSYILLLAPFTHIPASFLLGLFFLATNLLLLLSTAFTEPGIIPRRQLHFLTSTIQDQIEEKLQQYCTICKIVKPARAKHCRHCDNCVMVFDHHCPVSTSHADASCKYCL